MTRLLISLILFLPINPALAGQKMTAFEGRDLFKSQVVKLTAEGHKGLVAVFLSAKCPCSNSHVTELKELALKYPLFSFVAIHSNADEDKALSVPYFEKFALPFPVLEDQKWELADIFGAFKTPHAFVVLQDGTMAFKGGVSNSKDCAKSDRKYLREALEDLDAGKPVRTAEARTLGCAISRENQNDSKNKNIW